LSKRHPSPPAATIASSVVEALRVIPDHRFEVGRLHPLDTILVIAICAMICGADHWVGIKARLLRPRPRRVSAGLHRVDRWAVVAIVNSVN